MIQNSTDVYFGGLHIVTEHSEEDKYRMRIVTGHIIFNGTVAEFEAMCESHQLLKDACKQVVSSVEDHELFNDAYSVAKEALRRAD